ncbi:MAG: polymer-forming cytoskeletal protein [Deltaproteobacteria bacterium]|nr:polymer-forming cytoskeletal protein [Deltaproteobacteria bacterium]NIS76811.1 polymer-forming cytoskeletal protein [Deltaproteobacteria bacterium]
MIKRKERRNMENHLPDLDIDAFIGEGTYFEGKFSFKGVVRIDGSVKGELKCDGTLIIGETGVLDASIATRDAIIRGKVNGDIKAEGRLELKAPCAVVGDMTAQTLVVEEGVSIDGNVVTGGERLAPVREGSVLATEEMETTETADG